MRVIVLTFLSAILMASCSAPRPQSFVDSDYLPSDYIGRRHSVSALDDRLIIEVDQVTGFNVVGFDVFGQDGELYLSPRHVSSGGGGTARFEIMITSFNLGPRWPERVYWIIESPAYPFFQDGFWSTEKRSSWLRKKIEIPMP